MKTAPALLAAAALAFTTCAALAQSAPPPGDTTPFAIQREPDGALYIKLPLPAHVASQMQAIAAQRARDVEMGAANAWGAAQADWHIAQLRAAGQPPIPAASAPSAPAAPAASAAPSAPPALTTPASAPQDAATLPQLAPGLDDATLHRLIALFYESDTEQALREKTFAFRRDTHRAMKDVLIIAASLYSLGQGGGVDWAQLETTTQNLVDTHGPQITAIFLEGIKAAARARQSAAHDPASQPPQHHLPAHAVPPGMHHDEIHWRRRIPH